MGRTVLGFPKLEFFSKMFILIHTEMESSWGMAEWVKRLLQSVTSYDLGPQNTRKAWHGSVYLSSLCSYGRMGDEDGRLPRISGTS